MENKKIKALLGVCGKEIITFELETRGGENEEKTISLSFNVGEAIDVDNIDYETIFQDRWDCLSDSEKLYELDDGEHTRYDVFDNWKYDMYDYRDYIDCSCTDIEVEMEEKTINFQTIAGGQHDILENKTFSNFIHVDSYGTLLVYYLWKQYHLKNVDNNANTIINTIENIYNKYSYYNDETIEFIKENIGINEL